MILRARSYLTSELLIFWEYGEHYKKIELIDLLLNTKTPNGDPNNTFFDSKETYCQIHGCHST